MAYLVRPSDHRTLACRVARIERLGYDVIGLWLRPPRTERLQFVAGQYIEILLPDGGQRAFSLANPPHDDELLQLHIRHYPNGAFSDQLCLAIHENALLRVRGPLGRFVLNETSERPMLFVAGGTGFAPIKSMIEHLLAEGLTRPIRLYWGARSRRDLYMDELARDWAKRYAHIQYMPVLSEPLPEDAWTGRTGFVHQAVLDEVEDLSRCEVYTSGPLAMVRTVWTSFLERGLAPDRVHSDAFEF